MISRAVSAPRTLRLNMESSVSRLSMPSGM
jgi:hypothetical protein